MMATNKTLKDFINDDLDVFFNLNEFADEHKLDGEILSLIVVDNQFNDDKTNYLREQQYASQEVFKETKTIYVKSTDYIVPKIDSSITLDGEFYFVDEAGEQNGVIRIVISANES